MTNKVKYGIELKGLKMALMFSTKSAANKAKRELEKVQKSGVKITKEFVLKYAHANHIMYSYLIE